LSNNPFKRSNPSKRRYEKITLSIDTRVLKLARIRKMRTRVPIGRQLEDAFKKTRRLIE